MTQWVPENSKFDVSKPAQQKQASVAITSLTSKMLEKQEPFVWELRYLI